MNVKKRIKVIPNSVMNAMLPPTDSSNDYLQIMQLNSAIEEKR